MPPPIPSIYLDDAYKAYKHHKYKEAFNLYKNAVAAIEYDNNRVDSFRALYNLALCYDKGIGTKKNHIKAAIYYLKAYNLFKNDIYSKKICKDKFLSNYIWVLKRLYKFEGYYLYDNQQRHLKRMCK
jgi:TPR repeat protein